ncbi:MULTISPECIES: thiamine pyrophosphate-requiring protein [Ramlibacter]|uniref:Thiamine pyrophosphate-requiring protein n=1 Tax=Ramlibacter pinisoli TaxID=2682844 RepID=A0A6N8IQG5_9BURK|nr:MULTISPECIES: thiamine pyrophosphate-requiring protein [Ramlibacter]MBA2964122.1 thiamine pyrophosphate-requiring protein [Ramlibacter sp. CGMCC 1.13660]MVQ29088.1 thiamine pyrophosphate-requiring protein [Ramlibacter pinisoli]
MPDPVQHTAARFFLEGLHEAGIEHLFCNLGTDHVTLVDELARCEAEGRPAPNVVLCPHENVAIHMAGGYAAITGRGQGVLVHVDAGTANAAMGMHNLMRSRLPVLLMAGRAPFALHGELTGARDTYVHYVQDPFDIGSLVRPYVKWEYGLPSGVVAKEVVRRAHTVMHSDPPGPAYLTLPRETLAASHPVAAARSFPAERYGPVRSGGLSAETAAHVARELIAARQPLAVTSYLGRNPQAVGALDALARLCGIRVVEFNTAWLSIPRESPCFAGFDAGPLLAGTDLGLLLDVDVPWLPSARPREDTRWLHIDIDPVKKDFPAWGFATDLRLQADCGQALRDVHAAVLALADDAFHRRVAERMAGWEGERRARLERVAAQAADPGQRGALNPAWACAQLGRHLRPDDIVINEGIRNALNVFQQVPRSEPLSLLGGAGGGLGYSAGMALGARLARPGARVVHVEGDGGFHFSTPSSVYAVAQAYRLPILTVVLDNGGWQAVKEAVLRVHPDGAAARLNQFHARLAGGQRRFEQVAQAFGAHGERVEAPEELEGAITRCLAALDEGRAALLSITIAPI